VITRRALPFSRASALSNDLEDLAIEHAIAKKEVVKDAAPALASGRTSAPAAKLAKRTAK